MSSNHNHHHGHNHKIENFIIKIHSLSVSHTNKRRQLYVTGDFDSYKQFKTEVKKSKEDGSCLWQEFSLEFQYETKYIHKLDHKNFKLHLYKKKSIGSDSLLGSFNVDLYTLATGPVDHDVIFSKGNIGVGRFQFRLEMLHTTHTKINVITLFTANLKLNSSHDSSIYMEYSLNQQNILKMQQIQGSTCPSWINQPPIVQSISLKDLVDSNLVFKLKESRIGKDVVVGGLSIPIKSIFTFIEGDEKIIKSCLVDQSNKQVADVNVKIKFSDIPMFAQLRGGIQTEMGIKNAEPFFSGVPLPKLLGDNTGGAVSDENLKLPRGWEARQDAFGRTYYVDHNSKTTTWISPLTNLGSTAVQERIRSSSYTKPTEKETRAAILIQRTYRKHKKELYNKTIRHPEKYKPVTPDTSITNVEKFFSYHGNSAPSVEPMSKSNPNLSTTPQHINTAPLSSSQPVSYPLNQAPQQILTKQTAPQILVLPSGWEVRQDPFGRIYYVDHNTRTTTWRHPQLLIQPITSSRKQGNL